MAKKARRRGGPIVKRPTEAAALANIMAEWDNDPVAKFWSFRRFLRLCRRVAEVPSGGSMVSRYYLATRIPASLHAPMWVMEGIGDEEDTPRQGG